MKRLSTIIATAVITLVFQNCDHPRPAEQSRGGNEITTQSTPSAVGLSVSRPLALLTWTQSGGYPGPTPESTPSYRADILINFEKGSVRPIRTSSDTAGIQPCTFVERNDKFALNIINAINGVSVSYTQSETPVDFGTEKISLTDAKGQQQEYVLDFSDAGQPSGTRFLMNAGNLSRAIHELVTESCLVYTQSADNHAASASAPN